MSNGEVRKVSHEDLDQVHNLIERCLQLYMNKEEVVNMLQHQAKIDPSFTEIVWQKLVEQNQEFFNAYDIRLNLKDQILKFNELLKKQAELMRQTSPTNGAASVPITNGSHAPLYNLQTMNVGIMNGVEEPSFMYNPANNVLDRHPVMPEVPFIGEELNPKPVNEPDVELDSSLIVSLDQIPRSFSLSDLTTDFSICSDIVDNYSGSPYLAADTEFFNPHSNGDIQGDGKSLDTISEVWNYEGFGSY